MEAGKPRYNSLAFLVYPVFLSVVEPFDINCESLFMGGFTLSASDPFDVVTLIRRGVTFILRFQRGTDRLGEDRR